MIDASLYWLSRHTMIEAAVIPGTEEVIRAWSTEETWNQWTAACKARGMTFPNELQAFHHHACLALSPAQRVRLCGYVDENAPEEIRAERTLHLEDVTRFIKTLWSWFRAEDAVSQEEANRRAAVCASCPKQTVIRVGGCPGCAHAAVEFATRLAGKRTDYDHLLSGCEVCGCATATIAHVPLEALQKNATALSGWPDWCWRK